MSLLKALQSRNSHPRLTEPGPSEDQLDHIVLAGLRAPDHGRLRPWRFVAVSGARREALGGVFERTLLMSKPEATEAERAKARNAPLRAPLVLVGFLTPQSHPKVPRIEQAASAACALHAMLLAAEALGFGAVWRTGSYAREPAVIRELGGASSDEIMGFLYIGTPDGDPKPLPEESIATYLSHY